MSSRAWFEGFFSFSFLFLFLILISFFFFSHFIHLSPSSRPLSSGLPPNQHLWLLKQSKQSCCWKRPRKVLPTKSFPRNCWFSRTWIQWNQSPYRQWIWFKRTFDWAIRCSFFVLKRFEWTRSWKRPRKVPAGKSVANVRSRSTRSTSWISWNQWPSCESIWFRRPACWRIQFTFFSRVQFKRRYCRCW